MSENNPLELIALANELDAFIETCVPDSSKISKYGGTLFTLRPEEKEGQFCGVFIYATHVQLSFSKGANLDDERKMLRGNGKYRRHIKFMANDSIDYPYIEGLISQASRL